MNRKTETTKMRPRARLISLLGDELISDERVAVVELVKNSYDADASNVQIVFEADKNNKINRLIIKDDGIGMNLETVEKGWFEPGTVIKKQKERSPGGRLYQGAKGVGRFAAARLGDALFLQTKNKNSNQEITVLLEWGRFDDNSYLDDVDITYETSDNLKSAHGTTLTIENLDWKKNWLEEDFKNLHDRLSRLISPFDEIAGFEIGLQVPNHPELTGKVEPHDITNKPIYHFSGNVSDTGVLNGKILYKRKKHKQYVKHELGAENELVGCGAYEFEIRAWDRDRDGLMPYMLDYQLNLSGVRKLISTYCGVSIYRDGFRVHPYGEEGDDWLLLDYRSRQTPVRHLANNQLIASIKLSRKSNPDIKDRTTREGLVHNVAYNELKNWFIRTLSVLEEERYRIRPREDAKPEYTSTLFEAFDMTDVVDEVDKQLGKKHPVTKLVRDKDKEIRESVKKLQEHYSRVLLAAGLGQLVDIIIHEIGAPLGRVNREINHVDKIISKYELDSKDSSELNEGLRSIRAWLEQIANLRGLLDPKTAGKRGRATSFNVSEEIIGNLNLFENLIGKQNIKINFRQPKKPIIVHMQRSILGQIVANFIDNSIFWLTRHHGDGNGGIIEIQLTLLKQGFKLRFCDDGPNILEQDRERIFDQYFSTKPNGMGLGLYIARQIIEPYGKLIYRDDCKLSGACFEAIFDRKTGL